MSRQGYLSDSAVLERCVAMQSVPLARPDLAVRVGNKTIYPQNAAMMYANLPVDAQRKLDLVSDFVDRSRAQPQAIPPIATAIPPSSDSDFSETDFSETDEDGGNTSTPQTNTRFVSGSSRPGFQPLTFPTPSPSVYQPPVLPSSPRSPDADAPTGDSPTGRARDELGRQGRNQLFATVGRPRINSAYAEAARSRVSSGIATLQNVFRTAPSSQPQQELSQESQPRPSPFLGSRMAIRTIPFGS